ncbi:HD-GYP domain-containing protein [Butyrivibrio sp. AE2032]|uniref:HD-GYP domain-containing protein n=1 Tax=Butyrivibrio sp. AE2032 TaxID=1458463 RepID=UPI000A7139E1|nr:HD domain-containing phosphohydrolase [Butyrivibrio sp. AE2032]
MRIWLALIGTTVNVVLAFWMNRFGLSLYLDTIGTIAVSAIGGLFPGILTAVATNALCSLFNNNAIYFGFINALIALFTAWFIRKFSFKKFKYIIFFILIAALFSGSISAIIEWILLDGAQMAKKSEAVELFASAMGIRQFWAFFIYKNLLSIIDKGIATIVAWVLLMIIPDSRLEEIEKGSWKQKPLTEEDIAELKAWGKETRSRMRNRTTLTIFATSLLLVIVTGWIGFSLYFRNSKEDKTVDAVNILRLCDEVIDHERINAYISEGEAAEGYLETQKLLRSIKETSRNVADLYFIKFDQDSGCLIFDLGYDKEETPERVVYDENIKAILPQLLSGENVEPLEHGSIDGWMRSVFYPIKDSNGKVACYAVADVSITNMREYMKMFFIRATIILLGFFILVLGHNLWVTNVTMVYPIKSMAKCVDNFSHLGYGQEQLDKNVKSIRALEIETQDEVQQLYNSICNMTLNLSEQMRDLRRLSDTTAKMQDGLIITMADMVENRDSDTGAHIQKTASYVKIIVEGLKKKGYYAEKITPKFISDVVRSAPLHDIGKINISDAILNKPGKLTDEEYEVIKTHTTAGKKIMEDAISTVQGENYLKEARNMAAYHHERWDGKGYPEGLHGEVIPLSARIMAVADVFDALTSQRVYKPAFPLDKALDILREGSGTQFDPKCVEALLDNLPEVKVILKKYNANS